MVLNFFLILFQIFLVYLTHKKNIILRNKDVLNTAPTYWINKKRRVWSFSAKNPPTAKNCPRIPRLYLNTSVVFSLHAVLFALCYSNSWYTATVIHNFDTKRSDQNCLKSWWVTYLNYMEFFHAYHACKTILFQYKVKTNWLIKVNGENHVTCFKYKCFVLCTIMVLQK